MKQKEKYSSISNTVENLALILSNKGIIINNVEQIYE